MSMTARHHGAADVALSPGFISAAVASWLLHLTMGTVYCWGSIAPYVASYMQMQGHTVSYEGMSWVLSCTTLCQAVSMYFAGHIQTRLGLKGTALLGSAIMVLGIGLSSITVQYGAGPFIATYGALFGLGMGLTYMAPIICLMKWLPRSKGLACGIVVAGYGSGACLFNLLQQRWVNPIGLKPTLVLASGEYFDWMHPEVVHHVLTHVPSVFQFQAVVFVFMQVAGVLLLLEPGQQESKAANPDPEVPERARQADKMNSMTPAEMVRTKRFWLLVGNVFVIAQVVLFMSSQQKNIGLMLLPGASDSDLTKLSAAASLFNGLGRVSWGMVGDSFDFSRAMAMLCGAEAFLLLALSGTGSLASYSFVFCGIFFCIGGTFALLPVGVCNSFGSEHLASNYGLVFMAVATSELMGSAILQLVAEGEPIARICQTMAVLVSFGGAFAILQGQQLQQDKGVLDQHAPTYGSVSKAFLQERARASEPRDAS